MKPKSQIKVESKEPRCERFERTVRERKQEKSLPAVLKTTFSAPTTLIGTETRTAKSTISGIPQNFNSFRHVITKTTTGDDVRWILQLRDVSVKPGKTM